MHIKEDLSVFSVSFFSTTESLTGAFVLFLKGGHITVLHRPILLSSACWVWGFGFYFLIIFYFEPFNIAAQSKQCFSRCAPQASYCFHDLFGPYLTYRWLEGLPSWYFSGRPELIPVVLQASQVQASSQQEVMQSELVQLADLCQQTCLTGRVNWCLPALLGGHCCALYKRICLNLTSSFAVSFSGSLLSFFTFLSKGPWAGGWLGGGCQTSPISLRAALPVSLVVLKWNSGFVYTCVSKSPSRHSV